MPFNVTPQPTEPTNFGRLSEGIRTSPNTALGNLFGNLADNLQAGVNEADRNVKKNIENDIYDKADQVNNEFGVGDATLIDSDANNKAATPVAIQRAGQNLDSLQSAFENGNIAEAHYWARMNSVTRQLRAKYPGYRDEIDQMVSSITGQKPANALRNALFSEMNSNAAAASKQEQFINQHLGELPPDYFDDPSKYSFNEVRAYVASRLQTKANTEAARASIALAQDQDKLNSADATKSFTTEANTFVRQTLQDATSSAGKDWSKLQTIISRARAAQESGNPLPQQEVEASRALMGRLMEEMQLALHQKFTEQWDDDPKHSYSTMISPDDRDKIIGEALAPIQTALQAMDAKNPYGILGAQAAWIQATKDDNAREMLDNVPVTQTLQALTDTVGAQVASTVLNINPSMQSAVITTLSNYSKAKMALGQGDVGQEIMLGLAKGEGNGSPYYQSLIKNWQGIVASMEQFPNLVKSNTVKYMFSPDTHAVIAGQLDNKSQLDWLNKVASPGISNLMQKLGKTDSDSWDMYSNWVAQEFQRQFLNTMADVNKAFANPDQFDIKWNDKSAQFDVRQKVTALPGNPFRDLNYGAMKGINDLNKEIQIIKPIIEARGGETGKEIFKTLLRMGFDPNVPAEQGVGVALMKSIWNAINPPKKNPISGATVE